MRKPSRKTLIKKLDGLCREIVHIRDINACRWCGCFVGEKGGQVHHITPKKRGHHVRWIINNLLLLCPSCHFKWHKDPFAIEWFKADDPDAYEIVSELNRSQTESFKQNDLLDWIETLETMLKALKELECAKNQNT